MCWAYMCRITYGALCLVSIHVRRHRTLPHPPQGKAVNQRHTVSLRWAYMCRISYGALCLGSMRVMEACCGTSRFRPFLKVCYTAISVLCFWRC
jgi:hypothetical protein